MLSQTFKRNLFITNWKEEKMKLNVQLATIVGNWIFFWEHIFLLNKKNEYPLGAYTNDPKVDKPTTRLIILHFEILKNQLTSPLGPGCFTQLRNS
jgi:hypothetical protein